MIIFCIILWFLLQIGNNFGQNNRSKRKVAYYKRLKPCIILWLFLLSGNAFGQAISQKRKVVYYREVDSVMQLKANYRNALEAEIKKLKRQQKSAHSLDEEFMFNRLLSTAYYTYISDSALVYLNRNQTLAVKHRQTERLQMALIDKAYIYSATGLMASADSCLKEAAQYPMDKAIKLEYYRKLIYYYEHLDDYYKLNHKFEIEQTCDSMLANAPQSTDSYHIWAEFHKSPDKENKIRLIEQFKQAVDSFEESNPWYGDFSFALAMLYYENNQEELFLSYLTKLVISDIKKMNHDIPSFLILMRHAFYAEELDYANRFMKYAIENQAEFPERTHALRLISYMQSIFEKMQELYEQKQERDTFLIYMLAVQCAIVILCCIIIVILYRRQMRQKRMLQKNDEQQKVYISQLQQLQQQQEEANLNLTKDNTQISQNNAGLTEANSIREEYIGILFTFCSSYITKIEEMNKNTYRKLQTKQYDDLLKQSSQAGPSITKEVQELHKQFDIMFLKIYPNFLNNFNELLRPEERIVLKKGELLNSDLRIYAMVRLGVESSAEIAKFLHLSAQTVYNARMKMRNRADITGEKFSELVKYLGKPGL